VFVIPSAALFNPHIHLGELETEQPPDSMGGKALCFDPSIDGILGYPKVVGNVIDSNPALF